MSEYDDLLNGKRWTVEEMVKWIKGLSPPRYERAMEIIKKFTEPRLRHYALCEFRKNCEKGDYDKAVEEHKKLEKAKADLERAKADLRRRQRRQREIELEEEEEESNSGGGILNAIVELARGWAEGQVLYDINSGRGIKVRLDDD
jgi:hypothetical protein